MLTNSEKQTLFAGSWRTDSWRAMARFGFCSQFSSSSTVATSLLDWREPCKMSAAASVSLKISCQVSYTAHNPLHLYPCSCSNHYRGCAASLTWTLAGRKWSLLSMLTVVGSSNTGPGYCYQQVSGNKWGMSDTSPLECFPRPAKQEWGSCIDAFTLKRECCSHQGYPINVNWTVLTF